MNEPLSRLERFLHIMDRFDLEDANKPFTQEERALINEHVHPAYIQHSDAISYKPNSRRLTSQVANPVIQPGGVTPFASTTFQFPEYNFSETLVIEETEAIVARAFGRKESLCLKEGWSFVGKDNKTVDYIQQRLHEITYASNSSIGNYMQSIASDLVRFSNHFTALVRENKRSSGRSTKQFGKTIPPIAAMFPIPAETIKIKFTPRGHASSIAQEIYGSGKKQIWGRSNYIHFKVNDRHGLSVGTPVLTPVKDDIAALRRIEEDIEMLVYQHLFPLFVYQVGTEKMPAREFPGGKNEVQVVQEQWATVPSDGMMVVPERHKIEVLRNTAMDAYKYLEYFKSRAILGLDISRLDLGQGDTSNRSTSDSLSRIIVDSVKYLQRKIEEQFKRLIIDPLMLESTFDPMYILDKEHQVFLKFAEIDTEMLIKVENHASQMFSNHGITWPEYRNALGREPLKEEEFAETYFKRLQEPLALLKAKTSPFSAEAEALAESASSAVSSEQLAKEQMHNKTSTEKKGKDNEDLEPTGGQKAVAESMRPSNQHGVKLGPDGRKSSWLSTALPHCHSIPSSVSPSYAVIDSLYQARSQLFVDLNSIASCTINPQHVDSFILLAVNQLNSMIAPADTYSDSVNLLLNAADHLLHTYARRISDNHEHKK